MKINKIITGLVLSAVVAMPIFLFSPTTQAQFEIDESKATQLGVNKSGDTNLVSIIFDVIKGLLKVVFALAVLVFVIAGLFFLTSSGGDRADTARDMITYAIIGMVVSVLGYAIVVFLSKALIGEEFSWR